MAIYTFTIVQIAGQMLLVARLSTNGKDVQFQIQGKRLLDIDWRAQYRK